MILYFPQDQSVTFDIEQAGPSDWKDATTEKMR